jgi:2,3-dihydroxybenzoate-AMP ligase
MTAEYIAFHATERPDAVALINNGQEITYAEFSRDIGKFTRASRQFGLPRGSAAAVGCSDLYVHWLLLLAFEQLGIATVSVSSQVDASSLPFLARLDFMLTEQPLLGGNAKRHQVISPQWVQDVLALPDEKATVILRGEPDDPARILHTSGTTGVSKTLVVSRAAYEVRIRRYGFQYEFTRASRYLLTMQFNIGHAYGCATACIRAGGTGVIETFDNGKEFARTVTVRGITHITLLPYDLAQVLDDLPRDFGKPADLTVSSFGAPISEALRQRTRARLATRLCSDYGCNEAGIICLMEAISEDGVGTVWPGVKVEVVDERDIPLPLGQAGRIRVKTECMANGYLDDDATRRAFRNGWFYPGDLGVLRDPRRLQVIGRSDDLLNIGGRKIAPDLLEARVAAQSIAEDVGVCAIRNADGIEEIWVAVSNPRSDGEALLESIGSAIGHGIVGRCRVVQLPRIPRNATGKIQRTLLKSAISDIIGS